MAAYEVLLANEAVRNLMREGKSRQMRNVMISGQQEGMQTIEMDLARLVASGIITLRDGGRGQRLPEGDHDPGGDRRSRRCRLRRRMPSGSGRHDWLRSARRRSLIGDDDGCEGSAVQDARRGITPCPAGWLILPARLAGVTVIVEDADGRAARCIEVVDFKPKFDAAAIFIPVGFDDDPTGPHRPVRRGGAADDRLAAPGRRCGRFRRAQRSRRQHAEKRSSSSRG